MSEFDTSPEFEEKVRKAVSVVDAKPEFVNQLRNELARRPVKVKLRNKFRVSLVIALAALLLVSTAAYAYYRFIGSDPGLEGVNEQNLITDINTTALPTIYFTPPLVTPISKWMDDSTAPAATVIAEEVMQDVKVTVNWAYADESRLAVRFTISGLQLPDGLDYSYGAMDTFSVIDLNGNNLGADGFSTAAENKEDGSIVITANYYGDIDADKTPALNLQMNVRVGGFDAPYLQPGSDNNSRMRNIPLMGSTEFNFRVPVLKGIEIPVNQAVEANGVKMRLESVTVNRSHTDVTLCFDMPSKQDWQLLKATIRIGDSEEYPYSSASNAISGNIKGDYGLDAPERCTELGFDAPYDGNATVINVTVPYLITSVPEVITPDRVESANEKLKAQGIEFEYINLDHGGNVGVIKRPEGMPDWEVYPLIWDALADRYEGPWMFTVNTYP
jgi:hypothetical protein